MALVVAGHCCAQRRCSASYLLAIRASNPGIVSNQTLYLPLDDLLYITRQYINPDVSRSGIARLLKREGMARFEDVIPKAEGETISPKGTAGNVSDVTQAHALLHGDEIAALGDRLPRRGKA
jgi:hypothetical protein